MDVRRGKRLRALRESGCAYRSVSMAAALFVLRAADIVVQKTVVRGVPNLLASTGDLARDGVREYGKARGNLGPGCMSF